MAYITWVDAREHLDTKAVGDLDPARTQRIANDAETRLDNRLRQYMAVPVDRDRSPTAFKLAQEICSRWTAAEYLRWKLSSHGTAEDTWFADHLDRQAEDLLQSMIDRLQTPDDADTEAARFDFIPRSSGLPPAVFKRSDVETNPTGGGRW